MTDIGTISMVSYYNPLAMYRQQQQSTGQQQLALQGQQHGQAQQAQQHAVPTSPDGGQQYWYGYPHGHPHSTHHHQASGAQQYLEHADVLSSWTHHHAHHYSHLQYQHHQTYHQQQQQSSQITGVATDWSGDEGNPAVGAGEPSPPITISGSEISNPGTPTTPPSNNNTITAVNNNVINGNNTNNNNNNDNNSSSSSSSSSNNNNANGTPMRPAQNRSPYEWMKKTSYQSQPNPACNITPNFNENSGQAIHETCILDAFGKTRTKDKYRVVYTDHQRLELEKEFHYSRYITMRRKTELAATLALSERQVKIWFQNRRAKDRKQAKKREEQKDTKSMEGIPNNAMAALSLGGMGTMGGGMGGMGGMLGGLMHNCGSPPLSIPHPAHTLALTHGPSSLHAHSHQHAHPHSVLGL